MDRRLEPANMESIGREETMSAIAIRGNKIREIKIEQLDHGYIVRVGCQNFAVEDVSFLIECLTTYLNYPEVTEENWMNTKSLKGIQVGRKL